uniref:Possible SufE protein n=1 Tax=Paulinella chromatophora TaxID=39717 RepID=B1X5G0_PAUCH|nr:possible SufE protein [Paulinella chromatophora]ACB43179.1 possible SufE protein [Paulinella chromatophora]
MSEQTGSKELDVILKRLRSTDNAKRRYEYILWLAKKLPPFPDILRKEVFKVKGCVSSVYVVAELKGGKLFWQGDSDAQITKGLLALLIEGFKGLTPRQLITIDSDFIVDTGLQSNLTPSRANGFLNILRMMQSQAISLMEF